MFIYLCRRPSARVPRLELLCGRSQPSAGARRADAAHLVQRAPPEPRHVPAQALEHTPGAVCACALSPCVCVCVFVCCVCVCASSMYRHTHSTHQDVRVMWYATCELACVACTHIPRVMRTAFYCVGMLCAMWSWRLVLYLTFPTCEYTMGNVNSFIVCVVS